MTADGRKHLPARALLVLVALVVLAASVGCGTSSPSSSTGSDDNTIDFLVFGSPEELKAYRNIIQAFESSQNAVKVKLVEASDRKDLLARLSTSFAAGHPPDLFLINYRFYGQLASKGVLEPLAGRVASSPVFKEADFYAPALDAFRYHGELTCMPQNVSSLVVYYNKDLFAKAGVEPPASGWTWDDMIAKAKSLTADTDGDQTIDQFGLGIEPEIIRLAPLVWSNGGELVDNTDAPTRFTLDTPAAREALQAFLDLRFVDGVIPSELEFESEDNEKRFANGRMAMVLQSRRSTSYFRTIKNFDWDVAPLPVFEQPAGILHSDGYCMSKASTKKDAAWKFIEFAIGPQGAPIAAATGRTVPSLISVANSPAFLDPAAKPAHASVFLESIPTIRRVPNISTWPEIEDAAYVVLEYGLWRKKLPAEEVATQLDDATREMFARAAK